MVTSALPALLLGSGVVTKRRLTDAQRRRAIYGGALDTVLLEMGALDESTLAASLAQAVGLPAPLPERLIAPDPDAGRLMAARDARRLLAAPLGRHDDAVELALHPDADRAALAAWAEDAGTHIEAFVVPEVRFHELLAVVYAEALPPRFCALLGRMVGAEQARLRAAVAPPLPIPSPPVDTGPSLRARPPEYEIDIVEEATPEPLTPGPVTPGPVTPGATTSGPATRDRLTSQPPLSERAPPRRRPLDLDTLLVQARNSDQPGEAVAAIGWLAEMRVPAAVPVLIELVADDRRAVADAARTALRTLTRQDFGDSRRAWVGWWHKARSRHRMEWLLEALAHKRADMRLAAAEELQAATGVYFGYHFDLPERDRDEARRRWTEWWRTTGKALFTGSHS